MKFYRYIIFASIFTGLFACEERAINDHFYPTNWSVPAEEVIEGGPGREGIPTIDKPRFIPAKDVHFLAATDLLLVLKSAKEIRAYPHRILDWHEIVNDEMADSAFALSYCPLTGSGMSWSRLINGHKTSFGVSGLLYNSNLIPYDRESESHWSQMLQACIGGQEQGLKSNNIPLVEMDWATFSKWYPNGKVLNTETGHSRPYHTYPYGDYKTSENLVFKVSRLDERLPAKKRVRIITDGVETRAYPIDLFAGIRLRLIKDEVQNKKIVIAGNYFSEWMVAYYAYLPNGMPLDLVAVPDGGNIIFTDQENNQWNIFGECQSGPQAGQKLKPVDGFMAYWFAAASFFPNIEIAKN